MTSDSRIFVAGHRGMVGSAILRLLTQRGCRNLVTAGRQSLDLREQQSVEAFFASQSIEFVFLAAAKVGGILANSEAPAEFLHDNLAIQTNVIHSAWKHGVKKLQFLGSSCIYPKLAPQPIREESLLTGPLEPTNEWYAIAKIAGLKQLEAYRKQYGFCGISLMPTNLYGPGDNFDLHSSHVLPALIRKCHEAKVAGAPTVTVWGSGNPRREFLHVDDLAEAAVLFMETYDDAGIVNVGTGEDVSIQELAELVARAVGFTGGLSFDASKPDGTPRKLLDVSRAKDAGWSARIALEDGIRATYEWYLKSTENARSSV
ncbi:MAG: GDP-L-fucose synthase [Bryobacteraceae bacterium]